MATHRMKREPITTLESLTTHLQRAIELEFSVIPPYLSALYTIHEGTNYEAYTIIRNVVIEEMLHFTLACKILNAVGGYPIINNRCFIPSFPTAPPLSDGSYEVSLLKFSQPAVETFMKIELPKKKGAKPQAEDYETIGQFYQAIERGLRTVSDELARRGKTLFSGPPNRQIPSKYYYGDGGEVVQINDLESANVALNVIIAQGEGAPAERWDHDDPFPFDYDDAIWDGDHKWFAQSRELAHYFQFKQIHDGRFYTPGDTPQRGPSGPEIAIDWQAVYNMIPNPGKRLTYSDYPELNDMNFEFNRTFSKLMTQLHEAFNRSA